MINTRASPTVRLRTIVIKITDNGDFGKLVLVRAEDALTTHELAIDSANESGKAFNQKVKLGSIVELTATLRA